MTSEASRSVGVLARALDQTADVLSRVPAEKLTDSTPCNDWDVAGLMAHIVAGPLRFITMVQGGQPDWTVTPSLPDDWTGEFRAGADELLRMWRDTDEDGSGQTVAWQTAEFAVHSWDLARATGQPTDSLDPQVAELGLDFMGAALTPENRGDAFGPAVTLPEDATVYDRLVAFAGRDPR